MIDLEQGVNLVWHAFNDMIGGEIYVKKIPSMRLEDIARAISQTARLDVVGVRPGEKMHEQMIGLEDAPYTYEYDDYFKILPAINNWNQDPRRINEGKSVPSDFTYTSDNNKEWMTIADLQEWISRSAGQIGKI